MIIRHKNQKKSAYFPKKPERPRAAIYCRVSTAMDGKNGDLLIKKAPACAIQTQAEAVSKLFGGKKEEIKVISIRHGEKMYETLQTNEECAKAVDMGEFYRVPADNRGLNYDKYFKTGDEKCNTILKLRLPNQAKPCYNKHGDRNGCKIQIYSRRFKGNPNCKGKE